MECSTGQIACVLDEGWTFIDTHVRPIPDCIGSPCEISIHAEAALIAHAAREPSADWRGLKGQTITLKHFPCLACARLLSMTGIGRLEIYSAGVDPEDDKAYELLATQIKISFPAATMPEKAPSEVGPVWETAPSGKMPRLGSQRVSRDSKGGSRSAKSKSRGSTGRSGAFNRGSS